MSEYLITTPVGQYAVTAALARGDVSTVYAGEARGGPHAGTEVVVKIAASASDDDLLHEEARTLRLLFGVDSPQHRQLVPLLDQFRTPEGQTGNILRRVHAHDVEQVLERFPGGLPPVHVIWITRRLLSVLGFAHQQGVIHANVEPSHVLVSAPDHNVYLIDWTVSLIAPGRTGQGFKWHNPEYSAPEVAEERPPVPASDLFSVGRIAIRLLGGDLASDTMPEAVDERLRRFFAFFVRRSPLQRPRDAWEMFHELDGLRERLYGPHQFVELVL